MPALNTNDYAYIIPPSAQFRDLNGEPYSAGFVEFYKHGTSEKYITYADWAGSFNPFRIPLNSQGRGIAIAEKDVVLDMYVYNYLGNLAYSRLNVRTTDDQDNTPLRFTSSDGSVIITRTANVVDLVVNHDQTTYGSAEADSVGSNGLIEFDNVKTGDVTVVSAGTLRIERGKLYHVTVALEFNTSTINPLYCDCQLVDSEHNVHKFTLDASRTKQMIELSWDAVSTADVFRLFIQAPSIFTVTSAELYIHSVNPVVGGSSGGVGVEEVELTQEALTARFGTIADLYNELEDGKQFLFVYNDRGTKELFNIESWSLSSSTYHVTLTKNKPTNWFTIEEKFCSISENFSLYFYDTYSYKFDPKDWVGVCPNYIPAGTYTAGNIIAVRTTSEGGQGIWAPVELYQCILGYTEAGSHHPKLDTTHWKQVYLEDLLNEFQSGSSQTQADWSVTDTSSPAYIKNKPDLSLYALIADLAEVAFSGDYDDLANKPDLSVFARSSDLADVAFSGSYNDLSNVPAHLVQDASYVHTDNNFTNSLKDKLDGIASGAEVNVQSDWNQTNSSADDYIKNKPSIPAAQVQSDWNQSNSSAVDYIKNKPQNLVQDANYVHTDNNFTDALKEEVEDLGDNYAKKPSISDTWGETERLYVYGDVCWDGDTLYRCIYETPTSGPTAVRPSLDTDHTHWMPTNAKCINGAIRYTFIGTPSNDLNLATIVHIVASYNDEPNRSLFLNEWVKYDNDQKEYARTYSLAYFNVYEEYPGVVVRFVSTDFQIVNGVRTPVQVILEGSRVNASSSFLNWTKTTVSIGGQQVQSDWNQADSSAVDYIKNKPTIPTITYTTSQEVTDILADLT